MLHRHWWCFSVILEPRLWLSGWVDHMIDPKLKQADLICGTASDFWSGKVASFISITCYHVNLKTDTLPRNACKIFSADSLRLGNAFLVRSDKHIHDTWTFILEWEAPPDWCLCSKLCPTKFIKISKIADDTYLGRVSSSLCIVSRNVSNIYVLSHTSSNHKVMIIITETRCELLPFKQRPVRTEALSLAIQKQMCSKILDNLDNVVIELWFVPYLLTVTIKLIIHMCFKLSKFLR